MKFFSIKYKLLLAFVVFLLVVTLLNAGLTSYMINRQHRAEAFGQLSRQLILFHNDMQDWREVQSAVAMEAANDEKNLSDMAILYAQSLKLENEPGAALNSALNLNKVTSLNRLQLILLSARLSSTAVYLHGSLSHYVTQDEAGMTVQRGGQPVVIGTRQLADGKVRLAEWRSWSENPPPVMVDRHLSLVDQVTVTYAFPDAQMMVLHVIVPIQGVPRESFNETIVENLTIATPETLHQPQAGGEAPVVVGMFVFSKLFDTTFLEETAVKTGMLPAIFSPDGQHYAELAALDTPTEPLPSQNDPRIRLQTASAGSSSYYQAVMPWQVAEDGLTLMLSLALSRENTIATIRQTVTGIIMAAVLVLVIGGVIGYALIARLVAPIEALTTAVSHVTLTDQPMTLFAPDELPDINLRANDEVGQLAAAFNVMIRQLRHSFATLEQRVAERTAQLEAANKELEAFTYSVSHDLRAPLRHVDGFIELLQEKTKTTLDDQAHHYMDVIADSARKMGTLIDNLLSFSRMGRNELLKSQVDLGELVQNVIQEFTPEAEGRDVRWKLSPLPLVTGDQAMLRIVWVNLIANALKFTRPCQPAEIEIGCLPNQDNEIIVFIRDNGVGFDMAYADKLFGVFQRLHHSDEFEGTGIGLANVRRVVNRHGGSVWAEGQIDKGAAFYFSLPQSTQGG